MEKFKTVLFVICSIIALLMSNQGRELLDKTYKQYKLYVKEHNIQLSKSQYDKKDVDFRPWMKTLQRSIKKNWNPPKENQSKRVVMFFKVSKEGELIEYNVSKSSGIDMVDKAAIKALKQTAPFKPLPNDYEKPDVSIQFTFDYNVFGK